MPGGERVRWWLAAAALAIPAPALALDTPNERATLVGLTGLHLVVEDVSPDGEREGMTGAALHGEIAQRLRRAGLRLFSAAEAMASVGRPTLTIRVSVLRAQESPRLYVYSVDVFLRQQVRLVRDRSLASFSVTWSENRDVGAVPAGRLAVVREAVRAKVDQFVRAWEDANPER